MECLFCVKPFGMSLSHGDQSFFFSVLLAFAFQLEQLFGKPLAETEMCFSHEAWPRCTTSLDEEVGHSGRRKQESWMRRERSEV